jgi:hypothetical protein
VGIYIGFGAIADRAGTFAAFGVIGGLVAVVAAAYFASVRRLFN